jgi:hypothetical protein
MSNKPLPSLSPSGWIYDVAKKADLLLSYFLVSEPAQSETYKITTLQYILAKGGSDDIILNSEITRALTSIFTAWFDSATVNVIVRNGQDGDNETKLDISMSVTIVEGNQTYQLAKLVATKNSKVYAISEINNG